MRIAFLLPGQSRRPAGGFKVVYEYANRLTRRGHAVSVVHPWDCAPPSSPRAALDAGLGALRLRLRGRGIAPWFELDPRVGLRAVAYPAASKLPEFDALIATAWHTAPWVAAAAGEGRGFYLIQGYETWDGEVERVRETWRLPLRKVVISRWLEEIAAELGEASRTSRVPIGMDFDRFGVDLPPAGRERRLGAAFSPGREKGGEDLLAALEAVRKRDPSVSASLFGTVTRPAELPGWVDYTRLPDDASLRALYNSCAVFLQASRSEGWGLPASEAMLCGCALVTVENGGSREYAIDGESALVVPLGDSAALAAGAARLLDDEPLRLRLAEAGARRLRTFTWERSVEALEHVLEGAGMAAEERPQ
jgi:glycosyltransferase involved in cell wall biosynthesis